VEGEEAGEGTGVDGLAWTGVKVRFDFYDKTGFTTGAARGRLILRGKVGPVIRDLTKVGDFWQKSKIGYDRAVR